MKPFYGGPDGIKEHAERAEELARRAAANEPSQSVESCLKELREMFPERWVQIEVSERPCMPRVFMIRVYGKPRQGYWLPSLGEAMNQVRAWHGEQSEGAKEQSNG